MSESRLEITSPEITELSGISYKKRRSRILRKNWQDLQEGDHIVIRPSEIEYLESHRDELFDHRMFYKPIWHTMIMVITFLIAMGTGALLFFLFNAVLHDQIVAILAAVGLAIFSGLISLWVLAKIVFVSLRRRLYTEKIKEFIDNLIPTPLGILLDEVDRFNESAKELETQIKVAAELKSAGHDMDVGDHDQLLGIYRNTRDDLCRSLKTERIFRENPTMTIEDLVLSFHSFATQEFDDKAKEFNQLLHQANEIGVRIQDRIKKLSDTLQVI